MNVGEGGRGRLDCVDQVAQHRDIVRHAFDPGLAMLGARRVEDVRHSRLVRERAAATVPIEQVRRDPAEALRALARRAREPDDRPIGVGEQRLDESF